MCFVFLFDSLSELDNDLKDGCVTEKVLFFATLLLQILMSWEYDAGIFVFYAVLLVVI